MRIPKSHTFDQERKGPHNRLHAKRAGKSKVLTLVGALALSQSVIASDDNDWWSMGPVGGSFQVQSGYAYILVQNIEVGSPAELAGMQAGDYIMGAFGKKFATTGSSVNGYKGAPQGFAQAIERAESSDGVMPLTVLRPGVGSVDLTVNLPVAGAFGPAYPLGSAKFDGIYQQASAKIHEGIDATSNGDLGYMTGFYGVILLADPSWNETTGAKPYRLSINKMRDRAVEVLTSAIVNPVESINLDGTPNDGSIADSDPNDQSYVSVGLENWSLSTWAMFLAEYRGRTGDSSVDATVQRAADLLAGRIQTWQQPPYGGSNGPTKVGLMAHGGVAGSDYPHISYAGINIVNAHAMTALAMLKNAGATIDDTKMQATWNWVKGTTNTGGGPDDGNVGYAWVQGGYDSGGRTAGVAFAMSVYGGLNAADEDILERMKDYVSRQWQRMQHTHAYTVGGTQFYQFVLPYLPDRDQRFIMENQKMFYHFHRTTTDALKYFGGRENNGGDGYVNTGRVAYAGVAMAQAVASGNLSTIASIDNTRIHAGFESPTLTWPTIDARYVEIDTLSQDFSVGITDSQGAELQPADYTATWSHVSGPAAATFSSANSADTTVTFPQDGTYQIQLVTVKDGYTLTEPIDVEVKTAVAPVGYRYGANQRIFSNITGVGLADLTGHVNYPDAPDSLNNLTALDTSGGSNYGQRVSGYIIAPATGDYTFYVAGDDTAEFRFNATGIDPAGATAICSTTTWTDQYEWTQDASQASAAVSLTAGQLYYYELIHKQGGGGSHAAVAWSGPGIATPTVVSGDALVVGDGVSIVKQPVAQSTTLGASATFAVSIEGEGPFTYEWFLDGVSMGGAGASPTLNLSNIGAGHIGDYYCVVTHQGGSLTSSTASLTVSDAGVLVQGGLWRDQFDGISGTAITDLTNNSSYPRFPSSAQILGTAESNRELANNYGARWTGWVKPDVTGDYTFYLASDDASELWFSTDDQPSNKVLLTSLTNAVLSRNWAAGGQSVAVSLTAGQSYYIEVLHKEASGSDYCAVAWRKPGEAQPVAGAEPISGQYLSHFRGGVHSSSVILPPTFDHAVYVWTPDETITTGSVVGTVNATSSSTPISYSITVGNEDGKFSINSGTGVISLDEALDFETTASYVLTVQATDSTGLIGQVEVTVAVNDIYDAQYIVNTNFEPVDGFTGYSGHATMAATTDLEGNQWSTPNDARIWNSSLIPPLGVQCLTLGVAGNPSSAEVAIAGPDHGVSSVTFDYAAISSSTNATLALSYRVDGGAWVEAWSDTVVGLTLDWQVKPWTSTTVTINQAGDVDLKLETTGTNGVLVDTFQVKDNRPNLPPVASDRAMSISERSLVGSSVGSVDASDPNTGDPLTYAITAGNTGDAFAINAANGEITVAGTLNYDLLNEYVLTVLVTDTLGLTDTATLSISVDVDTIKLVNIFDGNLIYDGSSYINGWSEVTGSHVAEALNGIYLNRNQSGGNGAAWLEGINSSADGGFTTWNTGNDGDWTWEARMRINDSPNGFSLWLGTGDNIAIVQIHNNRTQNDSGSFNVAHTNNDGIYHTWRIAHDSSAGTYQVWRDGVLLTPTGVSYDSTSNDNRMIIGDTTGGLYGNGHHIDIDYIAYDQTGIYSPPASNDAPPVANDTSASLAEDASIGSAVATVTASDPNKRDSITFSITAGNTGGAFTIHGSSGAITTAAFLDHETTSSYSLIVTATDTSGLEDTATVAVTVTDVKMADDSDGNSLNDNWEKLHFGSVGTVAASADTDADGLTAFHEMVFGYDPSQHDSGTPSMRYQEVDDAGTAKIEFKFRRPKNHAELNVVYQLQTSDSLHSESWVADTAAASAPVDDGDNEWVTFLIAKPSGGIGRIFIRCKVSVQQ